MEARLANKYRVDMLGFLERFDGALVAEAKRNKSTSTDYDRSVMGLWKIVSFNLFTVISDFHDKRKFYAVAGCTRVILESVADATYLATHQHEAEGFWKNQEKIQVDLKNRTNKWEAFTEGTIKNYGQLQDKTLKRIKESLGNDAIGSYNYLCFYSHPNTAGVFWLLADSAGKNEKYVLQVMTQLLARFIDLVDKKTDFDINSEEWLQKLDAAFRIVRSHQPEIHI